jgi:hypothetical protein
MPKECVDSFVLPRYGDWKNGLPFVAIRRFHFHISTSYMTDQVILFTRTRAIPGQPSSFGRLVYRSIHDSIKPVKLKVTQNLVPNKTMDCALQRIHSVDTEGILAKPINKNDILAKYDDDCKKLGNLDRVTTTTKR